MSGCTDLARADALALARCGTVFAQAAEVVAVAVSYAMTSARVTWIGGPGQDYQHQLGVLCRHLLTMRQAYDEVGHALLSYARVLGEAAELALRARALEQRADELQAVSLGMTGPAAASLLASLGHEVNDQRAQASAMREAAVACEATAGLLLVAALEDATARAPRPHRLSSPARFIAQAGQSAGASLLGTAFLTRDLFEAVPGVGSPSSRDAARADLAVQAEAVVHPVQTVEQLLAEWRDGQGGHVAGGIAGAVLAHKFTVVHPLFGSYAELDEGVMRALRSGATTADDLATQRAKFVAELTRLSTVPLPSLETMLAEGVNLVHHEAHGGSHTILRHVGRDASFLIHRKAIEAAPGARSSFKSLAEAEYNVEVALKANVAQLRKVLAGNIMVHPILYPLTESLGTVIDSSGHVVPARTLVVVLRTQLGALRVHSSYLEP